MKKLTIICLVLACFLAACASSMYGVPQETWDRMSEAERIEAMRVYERDREARRQAAEERARIQAIEREQERARQAALAQARWERIEVIHRGEGAYGELIRVRLQGGMIKVGDRHHRYEPITFALADDETRRIGVADRKGREVDLIVTYAGGALSLDGIRFPYDRSWSRGRIYSDTGTSGPLQLRGVDVFIEVYERSSRHERELSRLFVIREEDPPVAVREREPHTQPPVVVREKEAPRPPSVVPREKEGPKPLPPVRQPAPVAVESLPHSVEVVLLSGEMKGRSGRSQPLERAALRLAEGETRNLTVKAGSATRIISLSYRKGELLIDGGRVRGSEGVRLSFDREWKTGKTYQLTLQGRLPLEKVQLRVMGIVGK